MLHSGTADSPSSRGQGTYRYNEGSDICWYTGTAYADTNKYIWARRTGITSFATDAGEGTAQTSYALMTLVGSSGNVGIGTSSPSYKLEVNGGTALIGGGFYVSSDQSIVTTSTYTFRDGVYINNPNSTSAATSSNSVMSIGASSGNSIHTSLITTAAVGIGTTSPGTRRLNVYTNDSGNDVGFESTILSSTPPVRPVNSGNSRMTRSAIKIPVMTGQRIRVICCSMSRPEREAV